MNGEEVQDGVRLGHLVGKVPGRHGGAGLAGGSVSDTRREALVGSVEGKG